MSSDRGFRETLEKARGGSEYAFEKLFDAAADKLHDYCDLRLGRKLRAHVEPLDICQETYAQAVQSIASLECDAWPAFVKWLYAIAENRIRDLNRSSSTAKRTPPGRRVHDSQALDRLRARVTGPITAATRNEEVERLREALEELDELERAAVVLHYFQNAPVTSIAEQLGKPETTMRRILAAALERLGSQLGTRGA